MARLNSVAGMVGELTSRFQNLETGHAARVIYEVWRDICVDTEAWRVVIEMDTAVGQQDFTIALPAAPDPAAIGADILRVYEVKLNGGWIIPGKYHFAPPAALHVVYAANIAETNGLKVTVALSPWVNDPTGVSGDYFALWAPAIYEGCVAKLSAMANKPAWYDAQLAKDSYFRFSGHKGRIRMDTETGNTAQPLYNFSTLPFTDL